MNAVEGARSKAHTRLGVVSTPSREPRPYPFDSPDRSLGEARRQFAICLAEDRRRDTSPAALLTLVIWRAGQALYGKAGLTAFLLRRLVQVADSLWTRGVIGAELPKQVLAGPGVRLPHAGRGIIIHPTCRLGARVTLYHRVTLGVRTAPFVGPFLEDDVYVGTGACVLGDIRVRGGTSVGANAVLVRDTEPRSTWVGPPASQVARATDRS